MPEKYRINLGNPQQKRIIIATGKLSNGELQHVGNYWAHSILWYLGLDKIIHRRRVKDGCSRWHRQMSKEHEYQNMRKKEKKEEEEKEEEGQKKKIFTAFRFWPMLLPSPGLVNPVWLKSLVGQVYYLYLVNALCKCIWIFTQWSVNNHSNVVRSIRCKFALATKVYNCTLVGIWLPVNTLGKRVPRTY